MNSTTQTPDMLGASNPFVRGYDNLSIERLILITYANDCPPAFAPYTTHKLIYSTMR